MSKHKYVLKYKTEVIKCSDAGPKRRKTVKYKALFKFTLIFIREIGKQDGTHI